jgi:hypothetical protein
LQAARVHEVQVADQIGWGDKLFLR